MNPETPAINPASAALLVMDYQPAVLGAFPDNDALLGRVERAIAVARSHNLLLGYVRVGFDDDDYASMPETNKTLRGIAAGRHMHHKDPVTAVHPRLAPQPGDLEVRKSRVGAFSTTDLHDQLRARNVHTLILAGIRTGGVVLTTMREAADRDYQVYVLEDGSADVDAEVHNVLTRKVFPQQGYVVSIDQFADLLTA